jgi:HEPN domain-containing protein
MATSSTDYRLKVAQGFLGEVRQDVPLRRWRSAVDNAQLAVENAAKALLTLIGPIGRTHNPAIQLRQALRDGYFTALTDHKVQRVAELAELLGFDMHVQTDYGDEAGGRTPWELFGESDALQSLAIAQEAVRLAEEVILTLSAKSSTGSP